MQLFKFGGASVKNADAVRQVGKIIQDYAGQQPLCIVVSAMGKSTNALEAIIEQRKTQTHHKRLQELYRLHQQIATELIGHASQAVEALFQELSAALREAPAAAHEQKYYDRIIAYGELISTKLIAEFLQHIGLKAQWVCAYDLIETDRQWKEARVNWEATQKKAGDILKPLLADGFIPITQGFIGATSQGEPTTLGREGSDYTGAILAYSLQLKQVTIWKDVSGVLNADPKRWKQTALYTQLPYADASEMTYYGASVIHPKTIRPLADLGIPLYVRSFLNPSISGTCIGNFSNALPQQASIIFKEGQSIVRFDARDLENISQSHLSKLLQALSELRVTIHLMMNTAVSFSICIDSQPRKIEAIQQRLGKEFAIHVRPYLELVTIMWPTEELLAQCYHPEQAILTLRTRNRMQFVREERLEFNR